MLLRLLSYCCLLALLATCADGTPPETSTDSTPAPMPNVQRTPWGETPDGPATLFTLTNDNGNSVSILDWGGIVQSIRFDGAEMVLGYDTLQPYLENPVYLGALIGRYGNRIANSKFTLDGQDYALTPNEKGNQLHGGPVGFNDYVWDSRTSTTDSSASLTLSHVSADGDQGFPGKLEVECTYEWTNDNSLHLSYRATTDKPTIVNLTNHAYFNISGGGNILDQEMTIQADAYTPVSESLIPTGELAPVAGTPFDFRSGKPIGRDIRTDHPQIALANGYDHNWALNNHTGGLQRVITITDPTSGRKLITHTTEPGLQIFTCNFPDGQLRVRDGVSVPQYGAICLETQHFPDSPNQENFTTPVLRPGETYNTTTIYHFE